MDDIEVIESWEFLIQAYKEAQDEWHWKEAKILMKAILELVLMII